MNALYSVNTWLSFKIAEQYYRNKHYVWCSPHFNAIGINPPSSDPCEIYNGFYKDVVGKDKHSAKISQNRSGLINGAEIKHKSGVITDEEKLDIVQIISESEIEDFRPLIFVIPFINIEKIAKPVSIEFKAHFFSKEFIIEELPREYFDIIDVLKNEKYV